MFKVGKSNLHSKILEDQQRVGGAWLVARWTSDRAASPAYLIVMLG